MKRLALALAIVLFPWPVAADRHVEPPQIRIYASPSVSVAHVSAALHVAGIAGVVKVDCVSGCGSGPADQGAAGSERWPVSAHQAGAWVTSVAHIASAVHIAGTVRVDGSAVTQPVSGSVAVSGTANVNCVSGCSSVAEPATFRVIYDRVVPAQNKYVATLFNTSATRKVVIRRIWLFNWQITAVTGVLLQFDIKRITARTAGSSVTPMAHDTADTLSAGITADHTSTSVTDSTLINRVFGAGEETKIGALTLENSISINDAIAIIYAKKDGTKGLTLRQNEGVTIKQVTNSTVGSVSAAIEFTDEPA